MLPKVDSGWLKIFEQKGWIYLSLAIFCAALRSLLKNGLMPSLIGFGWLADASLAGALLFGIMAVGSAGHRSANWITGYVGKRKLRQTILRRLDSLSNIEHKILSYLVQSNCQSFNYRIDDGDVQMLVQKGLLRMAGGHQNIFSVPFFIPDFVWKYLKERTDEFCSASPPNDPPWVKSWMAY